MKKLTKSFLISGISATLLSTTIFVYAAIAKGQTVNKKSECVCCKLKDCK